MLVTKLRGLYVQRLQRCLRVVRFNRINQPKSGDFNQRRLSEIATQRVKRVRHVYQCTLRTNLCCSVDCIGAERNLFVQEQPDDFPGVCAHFFTHNHATNAITFKGALQSHRTVDGVVIGHTQNINASFHH